MIMTDFGIMMNSRLTWIGTVLERMRKCTVTVFGDFCIDAYWALDQGEAEVSIETGPPVKRVRAQRYSLGGAGSVLANLAALEVSTIHAVGVVGNDLFGSKLHEMIEKCGAKADGLLCIPAWQTKAVFARQVEAFGKPCDVLMAFTTSGNSENVRRAMLAAKKLQMLTISFLGKDGGACKGIADIELLVESQNTARIQEAHKLLLHTICEMVDRRL
jgi:hypothetical protein